MAEYRSARGRNLLLLAVVASPVVILNAACEPECIDPIDCRALGTNFICEDNRCVDAEPPEDTDAGTDAGAPPMDAGMDAGMPPSDAGTDAGSDAGMDDAGVLGTYSLTLTGFGGPHANQHVYLKVKTAGGLATVAPLDGGAISALVPDDGGVVVLTAEEVLAPGVSYDVDFFADNFPMGASNAQYDGPAGATDGGLQFRDHSWRRAITGDSAGVSETFAHDTDWTDLTPF